MSVETMLVANYNQFAQRRNTNLLLFTGIALIVTGIVLNLVSYIQDAPNEYSNSNNNASNSNIVSANNSNNSANQYEQKNNNISSSTYRKSYQPTSNSENNPSTHKIRTKENHTLVSQYLITCQNSNQLSGILETVQSVVESKGNSTSVISSGNVSPSSLKGSYKNLITISGNFNSHSSSIDETVISTTFTYSLKLYDVESSSLLNSINDKEIVVGFSESENFEKIKSKIIPQIKSLL